MLANTSSWLGGHSFLLPTGTDDLILAPQPARKVAKRIQTKKQKNLMNVSMDQMISYHFAHNLGHPDELVRELGQSKKANPRSIRSNKEPQCNHEAAPKKSQKKFFRR